MKVKEGGRQTFASNLLKTPTKLSQKNILFFEEFELKKHLKSMNGNSIF